MLVFYINKNSVGKALPTPYARNLFVTIMPTAVGDVYTSMFNVVDKAVFFIDSTAKLSLQIAFQGFWLANAMHCAVSFNIFYKLIDAFQGLFILCLPVQVIIPSVIRPDFLTHRQPRLVREQCLFQHVIH